MADPTRLVVIDSTNLFWRSYHALLGKAFEHDGKPTFAIYGTLDTIAGVIRSHSPTHVVSIFDWGKSEYRLGIWPKYKAGRPSADVVLHDDVDTQMNAVQRLLPLMGMQVWREENVEADDIIAAFVGRFKAEVDEVLVITGDKDMRQLADKNVVVVHPSIGVRAESRWGVPEVIEHYGVTPERLPEVWALSGDKVDNVPGVPGIGEKTAIKFIQKYGDLSNVALSDEKKIEGYRHDIAMSERLVKLNPELVSIPINLDALKFDPVGPPDPRSVELMNSLNEYGLDSIVTRWNAGSLWKERGLRLKDLKKKHH